MNKRKIEELIPFALDEISNQFTEEIPKEYKGYIANFGASIIQSGLLSTVAFFQNNNSGSNQDRRKITEMILNIIYKNENYEKSQKENNLLDYIISNIGRKKIIKEQVINVTIAVKLAMGTFKFSDKVDTQEGDNQ